MLVEGSFSALNMSKPPKAATFEGSESITQFKMSISLKYNRLANFLGKKCNFIRTMATFLEDVRPRLVQMASPISEYVATVSRVESFVRFNSYDLAEKFVYRYGLVDGGVERSVAKDKTCGE